MNVFIKKPQVILTFVGVILIVLIFLLPTYVIKNTSVSGSSIPKESGTFAHPDTTVSHAIPNSAEGNEIKILRKNFYSSSVKEKSAKFANSLAEQFEKLQQFDSSSKYRDIEATLFPNKENFERAGNAYYQAFNFSLNAQRSLFLGERARFYYQKLLDQNPDNSSVKVKMAMTYVSSEDPMKGIKMLRDIVSSDPKNEEALFSLGTLALQTGQYSRAAEYFEKVVELNPKNVNGFFNLAMSLKELGKKEGARKAFDQVRKLDKSPEVQSAVESAINEMDK